MKSPRVKKLSKVRDMVVVGVQENAVTSAQLKEVYSDAGIPQSEGKEDWKRARWYHHTDIVCDLGFASRPYKGALQWTERGKKLACMGRERLGLPLSNAEIQLFTEVILTNEYAKQSFWGLFVPDLDGDISESVLRTMGRECFVERIEEDYYAMHTASGKSHKRIQHEYDIYKSWGRQLRLLDEFELLGNYRKPPRDKKVVFPLSATFKSVPVEELARAIDVVFSRHRLVPIPVLIYELILRYRWEVSAIKQGLKALNSKWPSKYYLERTSKEVLKEWDTKGFAKQFIEVDGFIRSTLVISH